MNFLVLVGGKANRLITGLNSIFLSVNCGQSSFVMGSDMLFYCIMEVVKVEVINIFHSLIQQTSFMPMVCQALYEAWGY